MSLSKVFLLIGFLGLGAVPAWCEPTASEEAPAEVSSKLETQRFNLEGLYNLNDGVTFLLQRYATLEALVAALQQGRMENQAFAIGAASMVPGAGQFINGDYTQGGLLLLADSMAGINANQLAFSRHKPRHAEWALGYYSAEALRNGIMLYATLHAANASFRARQNHSAAMWTGAASVVPGVGQAINGNWWEAAGFFGATGSPRPLP